MTGYLNIKNLAFWSHWCEANLVASVTGCLNILSSAVKISSSSESGSSDVSNQKSWVHWSSSWWPRLAKHMITSLSLMAWNWIFFNRKIFDREDWVRISKEFFRQKLVRLAKKFFCMTARRSSWPVIAFMKELHEQTNIARKQVHRYGCSYWY